MCLEAGVRANGQSVATEPAPGLTAQHATGVEQATSDSDRRFGQGRATSIGVHVPVDRFSLALPVGASRLGMTLRTGTPPAPDRLSKIDTPSGAKYVNHSSRRLMRGLMPTPSRPGFTLVELLLVIGLIVILLGLTLVVGGRIQFQAKTIGCMNNQRRLP